MPADEFPSPGLPSESPAAPPLQPGPVCPAALIRLALAIEFLLAWIAALAAWSILAGQYHIDSMAWQWKVSLPLVWAFACVRATMAAMHTERAWNRRTWAWVGLCAAVGTAMGLIAWYTHLQEPDEDEQDTGYAASLSAPAWAIPEAGPGLPTSPWRT